MNVQITNKANEFPELDELETAAPTAKKNGSFSSPLDQVKRGFYHIIFNSHATFRSAAVASLLNETALTELETSSVADTINFNLVDLAQPLTMSKLRERMQFKPGNGTNKPFEVVFSEDLFNIDTEIVQKIVGYLPKDSAKGMPIDKFVTEIEKLGVQSSISVALAGNIEKLKEQFIDVLDDLVEFNIRVERSEFNAQNRTDSLTYYFSIRVDSSIYKEVVESDRFDPYLLYLWVYNSMSANDKSGRKVISPRITVTHNQQMSKFAVVKPKVNERGFALADSGLPIFIPPNVNVVDKFLEAANSALDDNGVFDPKILAETKNFANRLVYVDWINDIMAYTTNTGKLESYNLGQVHPMDKASEFMVLETQLKSPIMKRVVQTLSASITNLDAREAVKYAKNEEAKRILETTEAGKIFINVMQSGLNNTVNVQLKHLAGYDLNDYDETPAMGYNIMALSALFSLLYEVAKTDATAIEVPSNYKSLGLIFRLVGVEYVLNVGAKMEAAYVEECFKEYREERERAKVDLRKKSFDIPNIVVGEGIRGLLPHQGRIVSCTEKTPRTLMLPVGTGGGKCLTGDHYLTTTRGVESLAEIFARSSEQNSEGFADLEKSTKVITRNGLKNISKSFSRTGKTVKIRFADGDYLEGLPEHRILAITNNFEEDYVRLDKSEGVWVEKHLNTYLFPTKNASLKQYRTIDTKGYTHNKDVNFHKNMGLKRPKIMDAEFAKLLGYIVAEGYIAKNHDVISITNHDPEILDEIHDLSQRVLGYTPATRSNIDIKFTGKFLKEYLRAILGGRYLSHEQRVPYAVRTSTKEVQAAFISAAFEGDGTIYHGSMGGGKKGKWKLSYTSKSELLIRELKVMLANFGIESSYSSKIKHATNGTEGNECLSYTLEVYQTGFEAFAREINFVSSRKRNLLKKALVHYRNLEKYGQNTNVIATGDHNKIPCGKLVTKVLQAIEPIALATSYITAGEKPRTAYYSLSWLAREFDYGSVSRQDPYLQNYGEVINRYTLGKIVDMLENLPAELHDVVFANDFIEDSYYKLKDMQQKSWTQVVSIEAGSDQVVYDVSVPGPHEYLVQGIMSHNTIISAVTAIKAIENIRSFPMITTKGNLVKGTITELNQITQGKINAIPLRPTILRNMKRITPIKTFAEFLKWYKSLPPNTIFVNSYTDFASKRKLFDDLDTVPGFADSPVYTTQYLLMIKLLGIKVFLGDESHMIKNPDSARSRNSYAAFSQGEVRGEMSGTMVSNTVVDLVGQTRGISPLIFGSDPDIFADAYGVSTGLLKSDEDARIIKDRLRATTAYHEAFREDWSYMLPTKDDSFVYGLLTAKQQEFYNILMNEAYMMLLEEEKHKNNKKTKLESDSDDDDDDDEEEDDEDEDEDEDAALLAKAKTHLQKVEAFLVAPDENEQYMRWEQRPDGDDLISPKVRAADNLIAEHLSKHKNNLKQNKIIIFGWNRVASQHFMKYSRFSSKALHYTAGNEEIMRRYETDETAIIMAADEGSVREGFNLQMTSLIIRQQSVWAPGDHEQTLARMYRPDPRGKYNRDNVTHKWVLAKLQGTDSPSLDMVKMARLVSKSISNARLTYEGKPEWRRVSREFDDMKLFKMNLSTIFNANPAEVQEYLSHWDTFVEWENAINESAKYRLAQQLEAQFNVDLMRDGKIIDINEFIKLAMSEIKSTYDIPGSKRVWVPWAPNAIPPDPKKWGFTVLGQRDVPIGTVVYTAFGPGIITGISSKGLKIKIYDGRIIGQKKSSVMMVADNRYKDLQAVVKDPTKWAEEALDVGGVKGVKRDTTKLPTAEEVIDSLDDDMEEDTGEKIDIEVVASILNGWPALMVLEDVPQLKGISDWKRIDPFLSIHFRTWQALDSFLDLLDSKTFIPQDVMDALEEEIEELKTGKAMVLGKQINPKTVRQFFLDQHKKLGKKGSQIICKPYFIAVEREVKLAFDIDSHEARLISWLMRAKEKIPGIKSIRKNDAIWINTFTTAKEAFMDLDSLNNIANVDKSALKEDLISIRDEIQDLKKARSKPSL